jgi:hypothetical protein
MTTTFVNCNGIISYADGRYYGFCQIRSLETAIADARAAHPNFPANGSISLPTDGKPYFESKNITVLALA